MRGIHPRYQQASRGEKRRILDEFCAHCGCHRKYAIRLLNGAALGSRPRRARRRRGAHDGPPVISILKAVWEAADYPWSGRRKALLPEWMPWIRRHFRRSADLEGPLLRIRAFLVLLYTARNCVIPIPRSGRGTCTGAPGSRSKNGQVPRADQGRPPRPRGGTRATPRYARSLCAIPSHPKQARSHLPTGFARPRKPPPPIHRFQRFPQASTERKNKKERENRHPPSLPQFLRKEKPIHDGLHS